MKLSARGWRRNVQLVLIMSSVRVFLVVMPVIVPFFQSKGLSMQDVFVLQALFMLMVLVLEVLSGYAADLFGRKGALVAGALFCGLGHSVLLFAEGFWDLVLFEACLALARSLVSGADLAIAYESARLAEGGGPPRANGAGRGAQAARIEQVVIGPARRVRRGHIGRDPCRG